MSDGAKKIAERIAALKEKTHKTLTAAKDVAPLIMRVDKDLVTLAAQEKQLSDKKELLLKSRQALSIARNQRKDLLAILKTERAAVDLAWERQSAQLDALFAQKSIQVEQEVVVSVAPRDTLLVPFFDSCLGIAGIKQAQNSFTEDLRG